MSRHRLYRNLDINDELDDDALSDGGEDDVTPEQQSQLEASLEQVKVIIGPEAVSGLTDATIKDALWELYFDIEMTVKWAIEEQQRRISAIERKGKTLPPLPGDDDNQQSYCSPISMPQSLVQDQTDADGRPRLPLIVLAQQPQYQQYSGSEEFSEESSPRAVRRSLSTITERTERTEASLHWPSKHQLVAMNISRAPPSSRSTSYGELIEDDLSDAPVNPNRIPVSPSGSALKRLSHYDPAPSILTSDSQTSLTVTPRASGTSLPPLEGIPEIPDFNSKSSNKPAKKSKLSLLATTRSTATSVSSRTSTLGSSSSLKTYPALRPSSASERTLKSAVSSSAAPSSTSSHIRRAIQMALDQEAVDRGNTPKDSQSNISAASSNGSKTPTMPAANLPQSPTHVAVAEPKLPSPSEGQSSNRPPSKLALLAQAKAQTNLTPRKAKTALMSQLAQTPPELPKPHTEYLTPIANGPTATTAITTSYQSFYSLTSPSFRPTTPHLVPMPPPASDLASSEPKQSKLAIKIKKAKAHEKLEPEPVAAEVQSAVSSPSLFSPQADTGTHKDKRTHKSQKVKNANVTHDSSSPVNESPVLRKSRKKHNTTPTPDLPLTQGFAFDVPSPDDVVLNARRGTSLGKHRDVKATSSAPSATSSARLSTLAGKPRS